MSTEHPTYEQQVVYFMQTGDAQAVKDALRLEMSLKVGGFRHSQSLIDTCQQYLAQFVEHRVMA